MFQSYYVFSSAFALHTPNCTLCSVLFFGSKIKITQWLDLATGVVHSDACTREHYIYVNSCLY